MKTTTETDRFAGRGTLAEALSFDGHGINLDGNRISTIPDCHKGNGTVSAILKLIVGAPARNQALILERDSLAARVKALEAALAELREEVKRLTQLCLWVQSDVLAYGHVMPTTLAAINDAMNIP